MTSAVAARLRGVASSPVREILALTARPGVISFAGGLPAPELLDAAGLREAFAAALSDARRTLQYSTTEGDPELRERIAARLTVRGLPTRADDVLVTSGSQQALTLAATVLIEPGERVLVEEPSYPAALQAFRLAGAEVVPVAGDDEGLDPDAVAAVADGARLLYTIPTFHNPTGRTLPLERRVALAEVAERHAAVADRGRPVRRAALPRRAGAERGVAGGGAHARAVDAVEGGCPGPADRLGAGASRPPAGARGGQAGGRPAFVDDRPGRGGALAGGRRSRGVTTHGPADIAEGLARLQDAWR